MNMKKFIERDRFLTEAMCECWHGEGNELQANIIPQPVCPKCNRNALSYQVPSYSTWDGFGKLMTWAKGNFWFQEFCRSMAFYDDDAFKLISYVCNPDTFADALHKFLNEQLYPIGTKIKFKCNIEQVFDSKVMATKGNIGTIVGHHNRNNTVREDGNKYTFDLECSMFEVLNTTSPIDGADNAA